MAMAFRNYYFENIKEKDFRKETLNCNLFGNIISKFCSYSERM